MSLNTLLDVELEKTTIPLSEPVFKGNEWHYVKDCLDNGWVSSAGKYVDLFEKEISAYTGAQYTVAVASGTAAIHTALMIAGIKPGDKVIVPTLSFIATVNPVLYCGAEPVFVDSEAKTLNMDVEKAVAATKELIRKNQKPKAIITTHLYGHPCDVDYLLDFAGKHGIIVIEDACESLGSKYKGKMTGTLGDIGCLSFNGNKIITAGGGGMLLLNNMFFAKRAKYLTTQARDHEVEYIHNELGYNYRLTNIQAALGLAQLEQLPGFIEKKRQIAWQYHKEFAGLDEIELIMEPQWAKSNYWFNTVLIKTRGLDRLNLLKNLKYSGITFRPIFKPLHMQKYFSLQNMQKLKRSESLYLKGFNIPSSVNIKNQEIKKLVVLLKDFLVKTSKT